MVRLMQRVQDLATSISGTATRRCAPFTWTMTPRKRAQLALVPGYRGGSGELPDPARPARPRRGTVAAGCPNRSSEPDGVHALQGLAATVTLPVFTET